VIIRIGMRCGYEGSWAQPLAIASVLQGDGYSRRGAAPTGGASFAGLTWEPRLGAKLLRPCGAAIVRGGAPLLQGRVVCWVGVGALPRGEALGLRSGLWDSRHCSRRGAAPTGGRVVCWAGVGAPPRGEAVEAGSILVGQPLFAAGRRSYRGGARRLLDWRGSPASGRSFSQNHTRLSWN